MVPPKTPKSSRRAGLPPRSKAGCLTCKAKHLKCDEARPSCLRCSEKGLQCGGYWQGVRWSFKHQPELATKAVQSQPQTQFETRQPQPQLQAQILKPHQPQHQPQQQPQQEQQKSQQLQPRQQQEQQIQQQTQQQQKQQQQQHQRRPHSPPEQLIITSPKQAKSASFSSGSSITSPRPSTGLVDQSSAFIMNWFENVCPAWSGFDSSANPIRNMAASMWSSSITVSSSLESMSAAFMASRNPSMRQPALHLMKRATDYIQMELQIVKSQPTLNQIHTGLLFSLFGLGTTICWVHPRGLGLPFFNEARILLSRLNSQGVASGNESELNKLEFFNKCMTYCNMLLAVVHDDDDNDYQTNNNSGGLMLGFNPWSAEEPSPKLVNESTNADEQPHPWTGISSQTSHLFTETVRLCRRCRRRSTQNNTSLSMDGLNIMTSAVSIPVEELQAERLEEELLGMEIPLDSGLGDTGDNATPLSHLALVAEAYRLASLLLLYQTFPSLGFLRLPGRSLPFDNKTMVWQEWIIPLTLHLVKILKRIPPTSGSRVIQPLLYISASTGLYMPKIHPPLLPMLDLSQGPSTAFYQTSGNVGPSLGFDHDNLSSYINDLMDDRGGNISASPPSPVSGGEYSDIAGEVLRARQFVMERLTILESSLPPTPVMVAKELVAAIWRAYDSSNPGSELVHWIDIMESTGLRSMFG